MSDEILRAILDLKGDVGTLLGKVDSLDERMTTHVAEDSKAHERIGALERHNSRLAGKLSVLVVGAGTAAAVAKDAIVAGIGRILHGGH